MLLTSLISSKHTLRKSLTSRLLFKYAPDFGENENIKLTRSVISYRLCLIDLTCSSGLLLSFLAFIMRCDLHGWVNSFVIMTHTARKRQKKVSYSYLNVLNQLRKQIHSLEKPVVLSKETSRLHSANKSLINTGHRCLRVRVRYHNRAQAYRKMY